MIAVSCTRPHDEARPSATDRRFIASLVPHHHLGMQLLDHGALHAQDVRLRRLIFEMSGYHGSELERLDEWARTWDVDNASSFPGLLVASDLQRLNDLPGDRHDTWWLALMIDHHRGAVALAAVQLSDGTVDDVVDMARSVKLVQSSELDRMGRLLGKLCAVSPTNDGCPGTA